MLPTNDAHRKQPWTPRHRYGGDIRRAIVGLEVQLTSCRLLLISTHHAPLRGILFLFNHDSKGEV